jgi:hypothetical protein
MTRKKAFMVTAKESGTVGESFAAHKRNTFEELPFYSDP